MVQKHPRSTLISSTFRTRTVLAKIVYFQTMCTVEAEDEFDEYSSVKISEGISFVDPQSAASFDCGICLQKITNAVAVCEDQLSQFMTFIHKDHFIIVQFIL